MTQPDIILLHGAGGTRAELDPIAEAMGSDYRFWTLDMLGHGGRPTPSTYNIPEIADDLLAGLDAAGVGPAYYLGYSFGGYIALYIASRHPSRALGCCTLATKFVFDQDTINHALRIFDPARAAALNIQPEQWVEAIHVKHRALLLGAITGGTPLVDNDLRALVPPVLAMNGDGDPIVSAEETRRTAALSPRYRSAIFEGRAHPMRILPHALIATLVRDFIRDVESGAL